jgi:hypothetical protein
MAKYLVQPQITSFGCAAGSVTADESGVVEVENPDVVAALVAHGFTLTAIEAPEITEGAETEVEEPQHTGKGKTGRQAKSEKAAEAPAPASDEAALDAALNAAINQG